MTRIIADSELMTNLVSAVPVPAGSYFRAILDEDRRPLIISISNDTPPKLQLIKHNKGSASTVLDIRSSLSLPSDSRITTFDVQQAANLWICLAVGMTRNDGRTKMVITQPFPPSMLVKGEAIPLVDGDHDIGKIERIWMSPIVGDPQVNSNFPAIYVTHRNLNQLASWGSDITRVKLDPNGYRWTPAKDQETPANTSGIIDIAPAVSAMYGSGLFVLYKGAGVAKLYARFLRTDDDGTPLSFVTSLKCPPDATCIAASTQDNGDTAASGLLIGSSEGIRYLNPLEVTKKTADGVLIKAALSILKDIRSLDITEDGGYNTVWFTNRSNELGYIRAEQNDFSAGQSALVLPANQATSFAVCTAQPSATNGNVVWQMLFSNDRDGNLALLQQASDTGLWRSEPFYSPSNTENYEVESYTITLKIHSDDEMPLISGKAFIASASAVEATLNGRNCTLDPDGAWYDVDETGSLDFIVPTDSLGGQSLEITKLKNNEGKAVPMPSFVYDPAMKPMQKMQDKLSAMKSGSELKSLVSGTVSTKELDSALDCFRTLGTAYNSMPRNGTSTLLKGAKRASVVAEATSVKVKEVAMDWWQWMKNKVGDAVDWVISKAGDAWRFVCKLGGQLYEFALDCIEKVCEAASWVWNKIKVGWQKLKDFVGFLFSWEDIKQTKNTISTLITASIGAAGDKVGDMEKKVDGFFADLEKKIDAFGAVGPKKITANQNDKKKDDNSNNDTSCSWAQERLKNGGATSNTQFEKVNKDSEAVTTWQSVFQPALDKLQGDITKVSSDIAALFKKEGGISGDDVIKVSKGVLKVALATLRGLVTSILRLVQKLCAEVIKLGNKDIKIPIFSALWRKISGHELTLFDAISLIIAIPTTLMAKIVTGEKPPQIDGLDRKLVKRIVDGDETVDADMSYKFDVLKAEIALGLVVSKGIWNLIKIGYKAIKSGTEGVLKATDSGPAGFFDMMGIIFDMYGCIASLPTERGLPGGEYRTWISAISFYRGCCNMVVMMSGGGEAADKALVVFDIITSLTQFGLYMAVFDAEYKALDWTDYSEAKTIVSVTECVLNTVSGIGYSTAAFFKMQQPEVSGVGLIVMQAGLVGLTIVEAAKFKTQYEQKKRTRFVAPSC